jgi:2-dehydro-3-deoxyphosphooctonate aldolase (KDO 8-P synthase)
MSNSLWPLFGERLVVIAGPCAVESPDLVLEVAARLTTIAANNDLRLVFKASFDKANRSRMDTFRSIGLNESLEALQEVKNRFGLPVLTDIHETGHVKQVAEVADILQIPAFLCRQTDLIVAAAETDRIINIKKGQFLAPEDICHAVDKVTSAGNEKVFVTERGSSFGYHNLVVDMRSLVIMRQFAPVVFDATHSVQLPGSAGGSSGGKREFVPPLARAAAAVGIDGLFVETHPQPDSAMSDGANMIPLDHLEALLVNVKAIWNLQRSFNAVE